MTKQADTADGSCDADCSLREAIEAANAAAGPDEITVPAGEYLLSLGQLELEDDVEITGTGEALTVVDANHTSTLLMVHAGVDARVSRITLTRGGDNDGEVGNVANVGTLTLTETTVSHGSGEFAGGIDNGGSLTLSNSTVSHNDSFRFYEPAAGGIRSSGALTILDSTVSDNQGEGYDAGGIHMASGLIRDSTIAGNQTLFGAAGIHAEDLELVDSTLTGNWSYESTGGLKAYGTVAITSSSISGNTGGYYDGGGLLARGETVLTDSVVAGNGGTRFAGGIKNLGTLTLRNTSVTANEAYYVGGVANGLRYSSVDPFCPGCVVALTIESSTISANTSTDGGGGGLLNRGTATLTNSTVSGNVAGDIGFGPADTSMGGGILNSGTLRVVNTTIADNRALDAAGIGNTRPRLDPCPECEVELQGSIVAGNVSTRGGPDCDGDATTSLGHNVTDDASCASGGAGDQLVADALLGPLSDNGGLTQTHALLAGSPALDAIPVAFCVDAAGDPLLVDQRGGARPAGVACDAGAFEMQIAPLAVDVDIRPGSHLNPVNPFGKGFLRVALLGSADFDVRDVDASTLAFGPGAAQPVGRRGGWRWDVDRDGFRDLVSYYRKSETGIALGDTEACLTGATEDGTPFEGCDAIQTVPPRCGFGFLQAAWVLPVVWLRRRARASG